MQAGILRAVIAVVLLPAAVAGATTDIFRAPLKLRAVSPGQWAEPYKGVTSDGKVVPDLFALARPNMPTRNHIHTMVRTPNGNDYGKDLLRQHHQRHRH